MNTELILSGLLLFGGFLLFCLLFFWLHVHLYPQLSWIQEFFFFTTQESGCDVVCLVGSQI